MGVVIEMGGMTRAFKSRSVRDISYCLPRTIHHFLSKMYYGYESPREDFSWKAHHLQVLLALQMKRLLRGWATREARRLLNIATSDEQRYIGMALIEAIDECELEKAASIARHCSLRADTRVVRVISDKHKFVWFGVPRVASCSISETLLMLDPGATVVREVPTDIFCARYSREVGDYFTFGFARQPLDRLWACWQERVRRGGRHGLSKDMDFLSFCEWIVSPWGSDAFADRHWLSQYHFLTGPDGRPLDFIGRLETIDDDWRHISECVGLLHLDLPHHHPSRQPGPGEGPDSLEPELLDRLHARYREDFESWNRSGGGG